MRSTLPRASGALQAVPSSPGEREAVHAALALTVTGTQDHDARDPLKVGVDPFDVEAGRVRKASHRLVLAETEFQHHRATRGEDGARFGHEPPVQIQTVGPTS